MHLSQFVQQLALLDFLKPENILNWLGPWALVGVAFIIFAECGILLGFFLPGDSLLFITGLFIAQGTIHFNLGAAVVLPLNEVVDEVPQDEPLRHAVETRAVERRGVDAVLAHDLTPILCVGETEAEREGGEKDAKVSRQIAAGTDADNAASNRVLRRAGFRPIAREHEIMAHPGEPHSDGLLWELLRDGPARTAPVIEGRQVRLRGWRLGDSARVVEGCCDPVTAQWLGALPRPYGPNDALEFLSNALATTARGTTVHWALADPGADEVIGAVTLMHLDEHHHADAARIAGCEPGAVRVRSHRGLAALREALA